MLSSTMLAALLPIPLAPFAIPRQAEARSELAAEVEALLAPLYPPDGPGAVVLLARGGEVVHRSAHGLADLEHGVALTPEAVFRLASVTKVLTATATAVLAFAEQRGLDLDGRLEGSGLALPAAWREIRLRQLLAHSSGLSECLDRPDARTWIRTERTLPELLATFAERELAFAPGTRSAYSNSNYAVLAAWLEQVYGQSYAACLQELVFAPAGLTHTRCGLDLALVPHRARGYARLDDGTFRDETPYSLTNLRGSGDLLSTADDLHRFLSALTGGRLLSSATLRTAFAPAPLADGRPGTFALGWELDRVRGRPVLLKGGAISGFCHYVALQPERKDWVVLLTNRGPEEERRPGRLVMRMMEWLGEG